MTCAEVQRLLSEYIEKSLDTIRMKAVETHLLSCSGCRAATEGLMDCIRQISELPLLDPPIGFTQRVMAHVREIEARPSRWRRVLAPFRVSAPLQATAVVLIAVLAVFLYQKEPQIRDNPVAPAIPSILPSQPLSDHGSDDHSGGKPDQPTASTQRRADIPRQASSTANAVRSSTTESRKKASAATVTDQVKPKTPSSPHPEANSGGDIKNPLSRRGPIQAQEIATGMEGLRSSSDSFGFGPTIGGSLRPGFFLPERSLSPITEPSADAEFVVRRREAQMRDQNSIARSESARQSAESDVAPAVAKQSSATSSSPSSSINLREIRWFSVPADQYDQFRKDLASEASIDSEKTIGVSERDFALKSNRELLIKVIIVSPAER
ncbi:MAG TPA: zf-HC2 domain-containing protein [Candidatus Binatia bacterium]|nr:zf-HC2 domain-containing protein [Candidatus Binatia bacterium]